MKYIKFISEPKKTLKRCLRDELDSDVSSSFKGNSNHKIGKDVIKIITIITIITIASFLRLWKLDSYPAVNADEAAIGYNAYSLLETGKDEHGNVWPIHFQSFNDYKPGLYFYLVLPFVKIFGLNEWSVRLPNALLGIASVYLIYKLVLMFNGQWSMKKEKQLIINHKSLAIVASLLLAISPWHIHFSRGGWEVNTATFFILLGIVLFFEGLKSLPFLMFSFFSFSLSFYTYHSARIITPLLIFGLIVIYRDMVKQNLKSFLIAGLIFLVCLTPLIKEFTNPAVLSRAGGVGLFADTGPLERINEQRTEHGNFQGLIPRLQHNKLINYSLAFAQNWAEHYHGLFLFVSGDDIQRNKVPETGQMYLFEIVTVLIGLIFMISRFKLLSNAYCLIIYWLLIAPLASALTFQSPHALRAQNMVIPLTIISAIGLTKIIEYIFAFFTGSKLYIRNTLYLILATIVVLCFARYQHMYWVHMSKEYPYSSQYAVKELVKYISENENKFENVIVTDRYDQPYILFLFYTKYSPQEFQSDHVLLGRDKYGFSTVPKFNKFHFTSINWDTDKLKYPNSLIVGTDQEIPNEANIVQKIYGSNGYHYFDVVAN